MVLVYAPGAARAMGIAVSQSVGIASVRSAVRRRFREGYRHLRTCVLPAHLLFIARPRSAHASVEVIGEEMRRLCHEAGLWRAADS